jgi:hypothetical protein
MAAKQRHRPRHDAGPLATTPVNAARANGSTRGSTYRIAVGRLILTGGASRVSVRLADRGGVGQPLPDRGQAATTTPVSNRSSQKTFCRPRL